MFTKNVLKLSSMSESSDIASSVTMGVSPFLDITFFKLTQYLNEF